MATEPKIVVIEDAVSVQNNNPGMAGSIAVIGAFDSEVTDLTVCTTATAAHTIFGTTGTAGEFKGTDTIDYLFIGASELLVANITTWSDDEPPEAQTTLTNDKLNAALAKLKDEEFDILFIAEELADASQTIVTTWLENEFKGKLAHGQVAQLSKSTAADYAASVATFSKNVFWINTQVFNYYGTELDLNRSTAVMAGLIAGLDVNKSLTAKIIPGINGVNPEYTFESGDIGAKLMELNVPVIKPRNRRLNKYICINSKLPNELDLYINRTRDYILNRVAVETYLGDPSNERTVEGITTIMETIREECVNTLNLLEDIIYHVNKVSAECVDIVIDKMVFNGVITEIDIHYSIEVQ